MTGQQCCCTQPSSLITHVSSRCHPASFRFNSWVPEFASNCTRLILSNPSFYLLILSMISLSKMISSLSSLIYLLKWRACSLGRLICIVFLVRWRTLWQGYWGSPLHQSFLRIAWSSAISTQAVSLDDQSDPTEIPKWLVLLLGFVRRSSRRSVAEHWAGFFHRGVCWCGLMAAQVPYKSIG